MATPSQRTLVLIKPDGVARSLIGPILGRFESKGFRIAGLKMIAVDQALAETHYGEHKEKPFFPELLNFIQSGPVVAFVLEGQEAIPVVRTMVGVTSGLKADPGTIRGDYALSGQNNLIHASDSPESAEREISLWFKSEELQAPGAGSGKAAFDYVYSAKERGV